jgi:hypothetical protein
MKKIIITYLCQKNALLRRKLKHIAENSYHNVDPRSLQRGLSILVHAGHGPELPSLRRPSGRLHSAGRVAHAEAARRIRSRDREL